MVPLPELLDGSLDERHASLFPHGFRGEVAVGPRSIPVSINGLGVKRYYDTKIFSDPLEDIPERKRRHEGFLLMHSKLVDLPGHPQVVAHGDPLAGADLELPLGGHHLSVGAAHINSSVQTSPANGKHHL